jgi:Fur family transcriptional regulator, ferric uptake regulator
MAKGKLSESNLRGLFHQVGLRLTRQRAEIYKVIEASSDHLDAEGVWELAKKRDQSINLATVYRTLNVFRDMGLIDQQFFSRNHSRTLFEGAQKPAHFHFTCLLCGNVSEFQSDEIESLRVNLEAKKGWNISRVYFYAEGECSSCVEN